MSTKDENVMDIFGDEAVPPDRQAPIPPPPMRKKDLGRMISEEPILSSIPTPTSR